MALTTTVTPEAIAVALGVSSPSALSTSQWQVWISDALMLINDRVDSITPAPVVDQTKLDYVIREAVVAQAKQPDNATQVTVSVDDASTSRTYRSGSGRVGILDEWWALLGLAGESGTAYAIDTAPSSGGRHGHADVCSIFFGSSNCSCGAYLTVGRYPLYEGGLLS